MRRYLWATLLFVSAVSSAHDDTVGARFVQTDGANATDCLDHDVPCQSIQFALSKAQAGNTVKAAAGIYDMTGVDPNTFLFGSIKAAGGYSPDDHFHDQDADANRTILVGVDPRYRAADDEAGLHVGAGSRVCRKGPGRQLSGAGTASGAVGGHDVLCRASRASSPVGTWTSSGRFRSTAFRRSRPRLPICGASSI